MIRDAIVHQGTFSLFMTLLHDFLKQPANEGYPEALSEASHGCCPKGPCGYGACTWPTKMAYHTMTFGPMYVPSLGPCGISGWDGTQRQSGWHHDLASSDAYPVSWTLHKYLVRQGIA